MGKSYGQLVNEVRNVLGFNSSGTRETIADAIGDDSIERERVRNVVDDMIKDGGLRRNQDGWVYQPRPSRDCDECGETEDHVPSCSGAVRDAIEWFGQ